MQEIPCDEIEELYRDAILKHYRSSSNKVRLEEPDIEYDEYNPICGDQVVVQLRLTDGRIGEARFHGEGCSISQASASMMTDVLRGRTLEEADEIGETFRQMMRGRSPTEEERAELGDLGALQVVRRFPVRIKCALLGWTALEIGIEEYRARKER